MSFVNCPSNVDIPPSKISFVCGVPYTMNRHEKDVDNCTVCVLVYWSENLSEPDNKCSLPKLNCWGRPCLVSGGLDIQVMFTLLIKHEALVCRVVWEVTNSYLIRHVAVCTEPVDSYKYIKLNNACSSISNVCCQLMLMDQQQWTIDLIKFHRACCILYIICCVICFTISSIWVYLCCNNFIIWDLFW